MCEGENMEKVRLGKTGMMVTKIGFGGIPIQRVSEEEAIVVVKRCLALGINFIDTAHAYTTSEERIGKAIAGRREDLILATKSPARDREGLEKHLKQSLERLAVDYIDLYQFHQVGDFKTLETIMDPSGPMAVMQEAKKAGLIKHIGVTSHSLDVAKEAVKLDVFETIMFPFNFITCEAADELLPLAKKHDVGFIGMKPLAGGMLDNVTIAFKYLLQFPEVVPIPGVSEVREIDEIIQVLDGPWEMTGAEQLEIHRLREELGTRFCRRCDYCLPCNEEIPISTVMTSSSFLKRMPREWFFTGVFAKVFERAANCTECGDCEERCPYQLPIREMMAEQIQWFEEETRRYQESTNNR